jgi:hypothetical protein
MRKKYPKRYYIDLWRRGLRRKIKTTMPHWMLNTLVKEENYSSNINLILDHKVIPWSSPNIWKEIVDYYENMHSPTVFEYGTGASSISHVNNLLPLGGKYIGVEGDQNWFNIVTGSLVQRLSKTEKEIKVQRFKQKCGNSHDEDFIISSQRIQVILKLRMNIESYVNALDTSCNVVIVDGLHRKGCLQKVFNSNYLIVGGLLVLMEAGRGSPDWWEGKLTGSNDYTHELNEMVRLGGKILDGEGIDEWPQVNRKSPDPISYFYPMEACVLIQPKSKSDI